MGNSATPKNGTDAQRSATYRYTTQGTLERNDGNACAFGRTRLKLTPKLVGQFGLAAPFIVWSLNNKLLTTNMTAGYAKAERKPPHRIAKQFKESDCIVSTKREGKVVFIVKPQERVVNE